MSAPTKKKKKKKAKKPTFSKKLETWEEPEPATLAHADLGRMLKYIDDSNESQEVKEHDKSVMTLTATPAMKTINGKKCVRVIDLARAWGTTTATILATDKPRAVPEKYIHRLNGRAWCELDGLRKRANAVKDLKSSYISREILAFLDGLEKPTAAKPTASSSQATDLGTAALLADARRTASQALAKAENNAKRVEKLEKHMDAAELVVKSAANIAEEASEAVDRLGSVVQQAQQQDADLAKENADIIRGEIERLTKLSEHVDRVEKDAIAHRGDALARIRQAERQQRDNTACIRTLEEHARAVDWTLAAVAVLSVAGRLIRLLRRR